jgi:hypothetical protein
VWSLQILVAFLVQIGIVGVILADLVNLNVKMIFEKLNLPL